MAELLRVPGFGDGLGVVHGFTTRRGGPALAPYDTLPLARAEGLDDAVLAEAWRRALAGVHPGLVPDRVALARQVHGVDVLRVVHPSGPLDEVGVGDVLVTTEPGVALAVRVADCVPVLLAAPGGVAAVHAGWRGVVAGAVAAGVEALCAATGARPDQVHAAVGPHIGQDAFEVGPEVVAALAGVGLPPEAVVRAGREDRAHVDLGRAVALQLGALGVGRVGATGGCTTQGPFYSWRREGPRTGRQAGIVAWWG